MEYYFNLDDPIANCNVKPRVCWAYFKKMLKRHRITTSHNISLFLTHFFYSYWILWVQNLQKNEA